MAPPRGGDRRRPRRCHHNRHPECRSHGWPPQPHATGLRGNCCNGRAGGQNRLSCRRPMASDEVGTDWTVPARRRGPVHRSPILPCARIYSRKQGFVSETMNPALYPAKQVEPGRAALGARVERDPSDLPVQRSVAKGRGSKTSLGKDLIEDVPRFMAPPPPPATRAPGGACAAAPPVPPAPLAYFFSKKGGREGAVPNPVWVH